MKKQNFICCLCDRQTEGMGNNPEPLEEYPKRCCDKCNLNLVIPARLSRSLNAFYQLGKNIGIVKTQRKFLDSLKK